jgi:hypothetical protein
MSWTAWGPFLAALMTMAGAVWVAAINKRGQSDANVARAEAEFRNDLLGRLASLEARVAEQERELIKERAARLNEQHEYGALLLKYEELERKVIALRPLKDEVDALREAVLLEAKERAARK